MDISDANYNDIERIKWFYNKYSRADIPTLLTYKMQQCNQFVLSGEKLREMDNYLKAIRQDLRKIFLSIQNINQIYYVCENRKSKNLFDDERETVAIYIEYIFAKYRVIIEYTLKILDMIVNYSGKMTKENGKRISAVELYNMKLDYLRSLIVDKRHFILNDKWFQSIRKTRNSIIHSGATCVVFGESKEKLFQVYDLEIEELVMDDYYLYEGNCVHFDYFISLNLAYLIYFIDSIFSVILEKVNYEESIDPMMETLLDSMFNSVDDKQTCVMNWVKNILDMYHNQ